MALFTQILPSAVSFCDVVITSLDNEVNKAPLLPTQTVDGNFTAARYTSPPAVTAWIGAAGADSIVSITAVWRAAKNSSEPPGYYASLSADSPTGSIEKEVKCMGPESFLAAPLPVNQTLPSACGSWGHEVDVNGTATVVPIAALFSCSSGIVSSNSSSPTNGTDTGNSTIPTIPTNGTDAGNSTIPTNGTSSGNGAPLNATAVEALTMRLEEAQATASTQRGAVAAVAAVTVAASVGISAAVSAAVSTAVTLAVSQVRGCTALAVRG